MNKKLIPILLVILIASLAFIFGDGDGDKAPLKPVKIVDYKAIVYGPALNEPLGTLSESFEGTTFPPAGWIKINPISGTTGWERLLDGTTPVPGFNGGYISVPPGGGTAVAFGNYITGNGNGGASGPCEQWLITPQITGVNPNDSLTFWLRKFGNYIDNFYVKISTTTPDIAGMTTTVSSLNFAATDSGWVQYKYKIGNLVPAGSNIYIGFREYDADITSEGASFSLDLVNVTSSDAYPLNAFNLLTPTAGVTISTLPGSTTPVSITWDTSATGATYKWKYVSTSGPSKSLTIPAGTNSISTTSGALDVLLAGIGLNQGDSTIGQWDVWAYKSPAATGPDSLKSTNGPRAITLKRQKPALTAFNLISPPTNTTITTQGGDITLLFFNWTKSGTGVTYKWKYASPDFSNPANIKLVSPSNNAGLDSLLSGQNGQVDSILSNLGVAMGDSSVGQWRVYAYSGTDSLASATTFNLTFKRAQTITIGTGTTSSNFPFTTFWKDGRTQYLYLASELAGVTAPTSITSIGFDVLTVGGPAMTDFKVSFKNTTITTLTTFETGGFTVAYNPASYTPGGTGWQIITLTNPFQYTGGNLLVDICYNNTTYTSYSTVNATTETGMAYGRYNDLTEPLGGCDYTAWTLTTGPPGRANTRFTFSSVVGVLPISTGIPETYSLSQNYPNPFNPTTKINFAIPKQGFVNLKIYDVLGREVRTLVSEVKTPGNYIVDFNAEELSSGVYFYKLSAGNFTDVKRMMLIK